MSQGDVLDHVCGMDTNLSLLSAAMICVVSVVSSSPRVQGSKPALISLKD